MNNNFDRDEAMELVELITEKVKKQMMEEIDKRLAETESSFGENISDYVKEHVEEVVEKHVEERKSMGKKLHKKIIEDLEDFQKKLETYYRMPYIFMAMSGVMLFWFGAWRVLWEVPIFDNGFVPLIIGFLLLLITGRMSRTFAN